MIIYGNILFLILIGTFVGASAGYLGSFMVLKRMSLVGDALTHVALPGLAIALALNYPPMLGAFLALLIAVVGVWYLEETSNVYPEALIGVFFTASLALGILITPEPELLEALFGSIEKVGLTEGIVAIIISVITIIITFLISKRLLTGVISKDLLVSAKLPDRLINLIYLLLVGTIVALGVRFVGTLLMGALVIIPAAAAKNISSSFRWYSLLSIIFGVISAALGTTISGLYHLPSGPIVVLSGVLLFALTYIIGKFTKLPENVD
ncbi:MAG: metal ABC transporter permease [Patescibacteria group bacterium]